MEWKNNAACRNVDDCDLFIAEETHRQAAEYCSDCPVRHECLKYGQTHNLIGTWGGQYLEETDLIIQYEEL